MKHTRHGRKASNGHRPPGPGGLKRRYLRERHDDIDAHVRSWDDGDSVTPCAIESLFRFRDAMEPPSPRVALLSMNAALEKNIYLIGRTNAPLFFPSLSPDAPDDYTYNDSALARTRPGVDGSCPTRLSERLSRFIFNYHHQLVSACPPWSGDALVLTQACRAARARFRLLLQRNMPLGARERMQRENALDATLVLAYTFAPFWIRSPRWWECPDSTFAHCLNSFVRHLFVQHTIPQWLNSLWARQEKPDAKWLCWAIVLGQGESLSKCGQQMDWHIPRGLVRHLFDAPADLRPEQACRFAEIARLGGTAVEFAYPWCAGGFGDDPTEGMPDECHAFWEATVRWLVRHRAAVAAGNVYRLLNWAGHEFSEGLRDGRSFSWGGRSPVQCMRQARQYAATWHEDVQSVDVNLCWVGHGWDWDRTEGGVQWSIQELVCAGDLILEGRTLHHCVGSYAAACHSGCAAIFSLRQAGSRRLTIEVDPRTRQIRQALGACNRQAAPEERHIVETWLREVLRSKPH